MFSTAVNVFVMNIEIHTWTSKKKVRVLIWFYRLRIYVGASNKNG